MHDINEAMRRAAGLPPSPSPSRPPLELAGAPLESLRAAGLPPSMGIASNVAAVRGKAKDGPLALALRMAAGFSVGHRVPTELGGQPVRRFTKEVIRAGRYVKAADGLSFQVTLETLDHWVSVFRAMRAAGVRVPVPVTHTDDPEANRGWLVDLQRSGESLVGTIDLVGADAIRLAGTCDVSIYSPAEHIDGHGNRYVRPILHVALCTDPVVPGLSPFQPA